MAERVLTSGEIGLAKKVFKDLLDYSAIKVHNKRYLPFQPDNSHRTAGSNHRGLLSLVHRSDRACTEAN